jgi:hypothetical protein
MQLNRDFPFEFLPPSGVGPFYDFSRAPRICKSFFQFANRSKDSHPNLSNPAHRPVAVYKLPVALVAATPSFPSVQNSVLPSILSIILSPRIPDHACPAPAGPQSSDTPFHNS